ncbi:acid-sensing ion channel 4-like [Eriocheir sinensis]|uniref:acid-sensing ion channel 4-like n=1 Tax=Eriocheir sinensis TaxID=95602 RepID=UPI0021CA3DE4|nr:acid-sensing ion channel 4-like [Eriocheir sinensis]
MFVVSAAAVMGDGGDGAVQSRSQGIPPDMKPAVGRSLEWVLRSRGWPAASPACQVPRQESWVGAGLGLQDLRLPGVSRVASPREHWTRRVLWAVVLACGLAGTIYLISSKVILYLSMPTSMRVSYDDANTLTALPAITVCVREMYDYHNLLKLWREAGQKGRLPKDADVQLLSVSNLTLDEVWRRGGYERERLVGQCFVGPGKNCEERGVWRPVLTRYGYCHSFSGATTSVPGQQFGIYLVLRYRGHPYGIPFRGFIVSDCMGALIPFLPFSIFG